MNLEKIAQALVKINITDSTYQTGFLFTNSGHILSAGHGFSGVSNSKDKQYTIKFEDDPVTITYKTRLVEFEYDKLGYKDYAVLKILDKEFYDRMKLKLTLESNTNLIGKRISVIGYAANMESSRVSIYEGKVLHKHPLTNHNRNDNNFWLQLKINTQIELMGMSGAPVLYNGKVVGIQNSQVINATNDCFATPIQCINSSLIVSEAKNLSSKFYLQPQYFHGYRSAEEGNFRVKKNRNILFISDNSNDIEAQISNSIIDHTPKNEFSNLLEECINILRPFVNKPFPKIEIRMIPIPSEEVNEVPEILSTFDTQFSKFSHLVRCVVDTGKHTTPVFINHLHQNKELSSHLIGIELNHTSVDTVTCSKSDGYDILFSINYSEYKYAKKVIEKILLGLLLDIAYFWSVAGLRLLINDIPSQKSFSLRKKYFAQIESKSIFGSIPIPDDVSYISFFWLFDGINSSLNLFSYYKFWEKFLGDDGGVFSLIQENNMTMMSIKQDELISHVKSTPKLSGQISTSKLNALIPTVERNTLAVLLILVKRPKGKAETARVVSVFGSNKQKSIIILTGQRITAAMSISHLVKFFYFILK